MAKKSKATSKPKPESGRKPEMRDLDAEFSRLFWAARQEHVRLRSKATAESPAHFAALAFAREREWGWVERLLEASRASWARDPNKALAIIDDPALAVPETWLGLRIVLQGTARFFDDDYDGAIESFRKALDTPGYDEPGTAWNGLGAALGKKGDYDGAIRAFRAALDTPGYDTPGNAWNNLGLALAAKGDHDGAIEAYREALDTPGYDDPGTAWNNLGLVLAAKGDHEGAIEVYKKAIDTTGYDTPGYAWNNMGIALRAKGDHDGAIEAYRKALDTPGYDRPEGAWNNLALAYEHAGRVEDARNAYEQAIACSDADSAQVARARRGLQLLKSGLDAEARSADDRALSESVVADESTGEIELQIIAEIERSDETQYEKYLSKQPSGRDDTLSILRGWSSAVTLLEGSERLWRGGGYFLKWRGHGIVIDPGFDFLRNFHDEGYHGREIHAVLVSHNHSDHNSDLKQIDDLRYELFKRREDDTDIRPYVLIWDEDTSQAKKDFGFEKPKHRHHEVVFSSGYPQPMDLRGHDCEIPILVKPFKVDHGSDVPHAMGFVIELLDDKGGVALRVGYTGDTRYSSKLSADIGECDALIAHISQPSIAELKNPTELKDTHLGYRGVVRLLQDCRPKLALIGEFWAGFADLRIPLVKGIRQRSGVEHVLPTGLGMHLKIPSLEIECTDCGKATPYSRIRVAPSPEHFGKLAYLCPSCVL